MPARNLQRPCPICRRLTTYFEEPVGPFCSKRCQMVDLGKWMNEDYAISEPLRPEDVAELEEAEGEER